MRFEVTELCAALGARSVGPPVAVVDGLATDSRAVVEGQLFAAVRAERDGHDFVAGAVASGAVAALVDHEVEGAPCLVVPDVRVALTALARHARDRLPGRVVGVTGSVGKTTTKDLLAAVLSQRFVTAASQRSFNNELGVPLTLANAPDDVEVVVVEMGARGAGHIAFLCEMARPTIGVVTTVEAVHTEVMGDLDQIARTKGELIASLPTEGLAVLNADVPLVAAMASRTRATVMTFGERGEVRASEVRAGDDLRPSFVLHTPSGDAEVHLAVRGVHNVSNALAAATVGLGLGLRPEQIATGLAAGGSSPWRMELGTSPTGALVLNDAYNAGPASMAAALRSLAELPATRRHAVLGVMAELGGSAPEEHRRVAQLAAELDVELVAFETDLYGRAPVRGVHDAVEALGPLAEGDAVLVKGSRVAGLERVAERLMTP